MKFQYQMEAIEVTIPDEIIDAPSFSEDINNQFVV
jgi:hypothetical protein